MNKTISSSSFDVIVIRQPSGSYKSTPFQVAFSSNLLRNLTKKNQVQLFVNDQKIDIPLRLDVKNGRIAFIKKYEKRNILSDSSDFSDDDISQTSQTRDKIVSKNMSLAEKKQRTQDYKNQKAPKPFWQFAWLFKTKAAEDSDQQLPIQILKEEFPAQVQTGAESQVSTLQKIDQELYQGQDTSKQPMFHISLCKSALKRKQRREQILAQFFKRRIPYQQFIRDPPKYLSDSELIVKIDDSLYTWQLGIAILTCRLAYGKELSPLLIDDMIRNKFTKSKFITYFTGQNLTKIDISNTTGKKQFTITNSSTNNFPTKIVTRYRKSPDTQTIQKMQLKQGLNKAKFILNTGATKQQINMKIFLWDYNQKLIVSDIDGTITKSDIAGQLLTNYIHVGVTKLFAQAYKRGYKIVYLTARAIGQYNQTTKFLESAEEDGVKLPQGPLLMSPDGFLRSFTREVIDKTPDFLKTKILATLNQIFPHSRKPLFCGFGNRQTDSVAYLRTNMDPEKIFFITPKSIISKQSKADFTTTYVQMMQKIQEYFPVYTKQQEQATSNAEDNLRISKNSVDMDQEQQSSAKRKKSLSQSSEPASTLINQLQSLKMSQRIKRPTHDQQDQLEQYISSSKHPRSKSVEHNVGQNLIYKMQQMQALLKGTTSNTPTKINPFDQKKQVVKVMSPTKMKKKQMEQRIQSFNQPLPAEAEYEAVDENKVLVKDGRKLEQQNQNQDKNDECDMEKEDNWEIKEILAEEENQGEENQGEESKVEKDDITNQNENNNETEQIQGVNETKQQEPTQSKEKKPKNRKQFTKQNDQGDDASNQYSNSSKSKSNEKIKIQ